MRFFAIVMAALVALPVCATATQTQARAPMAHAGSACAFGAYGSSAIGSVLPSVGGPDIPGPRGNEVRQIYRVFYAYRDNGTNRTGFAGWLTASFDGRYAFTPAGVPTPDHLLSLWSLGVTPTNPNHLAVGAWVRDLANRTHLKADEAVEPLLRVQPLSTALSPCFAHSWDGKSA